MMTQHSSSSTKYTTQTSSSGKEGNRWYRSKVIVERILLFTDPKTAFRSRSVTRMWQQAVLELDEPGFWGGLIASCFPSFRMTWKHLQMVHDMYNELRTFSMTDLKVTAEIPHLLIADCSGIPLAWLTNVPMTAKCYDLYDIASEFLPDGTVDCPDLVAVGVVLEKTKRLMELSWPGRKGKMAWRMDLLVTVRGLLWQWDENKDTVSVILERKKKQRATVRPMGFAYALQQAKREKELRETKRIELAAANVDELEAIDLQI